MTNKKPWIALVALAPLATKTSRNIQKCGQFMAVLLSILFSQNSLAATTQSARATLNLGLSYFQTGPDGLMSPLGYFLMFQVEQQTSWLRPTFGGKIGYDSNGNQLLYGEMLGGAQFQASVDYLRPFVEANALLGWASYNNSGNNYIGLLYGFALSAGFDISFAAKQDASALRLMTSLHYPFGSMGGGLQATNLAAVEFSIGYSF